MAPEKDYFNVIVALVLGSVLSVTVSLAKLPETLRWVTTGESVRGEVIGPVHTDCFLGGCYVAEVRYTTREGETFTDVVDVERDAALGSTLDVFYLPGTPQEAFADRPGWGLIPVFLLGPGLLFVIVGILLARGVVHLTSDERRYVMPKDRT